MRGGRRDGFQNDSQGGRGRGRGREREGGREGAKAVRTGEQRRKTSPLSTSLVPEQPERFATLTSLRRPPPFQHPCIELTSVHFYPPLETSKLFILLFRGTDKSPSSRLLSLRYSNGLTSIFQTDFHRFSRQTFRVSQEISNNFCIRNQLLRSESKKYRAVNYHRQINVYDCRNASSPIEAMNQSIIPGSNDKSREIGHAESLAMV